MTRVLLLVLVVAAAGWSKSYFVDFTNGSDASPGTSTSQSWKHCPGDEHATDSPRHVALRADDTVFFRGGIAYVGRIDLPWSGTAKHVLAYDGNSSGQWGWGKAIVDGGNTALYGFGGGELPVAHVSIINFEIRNLAYNRAMPWGSGKGICCNACTSVVIQTCFLHDIGWWKNDGSFVPAGNGVKLAKATACTVSFCEVTRCGESGVWLDGAQQCIVSNNDVHDFVTWGIDLSGSSRLCADNIIADNTVHDLYQYDNGFWRGKGDPPHQDFLFIRKADGIRPVRNIVERNLFYNNCEFHEFGGTAMAFLSYADGTILRNNVFVNAHSFSAAFFGWTSTGTRFYNNTVYCPRTGALRLETGGDNDIKDNIFVCASSGITFQDSSDERRLLTDYNIFSVPDDDKAVAKASPWTGWSFRAWQKRGYDRHSRLLASLESLGLASVRGYPLACDSMDLHPVSTSPCAKAGMPLAGFADDKDRVARSANNWDCGAFRRRGSGELYAPKDH